MQTLRDAINSNDTLKSVGTVTEYLPHYAEMTYTFTEGLSARIADHGNGMFQMTLDGWLDMQPGTVAQVITKLESI